MVDQHTTTGSGGRASQPSVQNGSGGMADLKGTLRENEPMARHVTWRAGGPATAAYTPRDLDDLETFLRRLRPDEPLMVLGLGSNLLVRDGGYDGTVVFTHGALGRLEIDARDGLIYAEAGVASPKLARFAALHDRVGAEFLAGIPGCVGGALAMNAGCHGSETWQYVERVLMLDRSGQRILRTARDFEIGYRHVGLRQASDELFAAAWFRFETGNGAAARGRMRELLERRAATQPLQLPNAGSVFRNPPGDHAARLIEAAGLKGVTAAANPDGARVSELHANFIVNPGGRGSATEIESLIEHVQSVVKEKFGVELIREVRIVGVAAREGTR